MGNPCRECDNGGGGAALDVYAVVDIGSNTVHMLVAASDGVDLRQVDDVSDHLRLGVDLELTGSISPEKIEATAETVRRFVQRAEDLGAIQVRLLATQAVRASKNQQEVVRAIARASNRTVQVLEPEREAYYAVIGAALTRSWELPHLVIDVGGASTQISVAAAESLLSWRSVPVGSGRLASRLAHDPPTRDELRLVRERVRQVIGPAIEDLFSREEAALRGAVVVGGAMKRVARLIADAGPPWRIRSEELDRGISLLDRHPAGTIAATRPVEYDRVPMTRAGAIILQELLRAARLTECTISPYGIREGAILDAARTAPWQGAVRVNEGPQGRGQSTQASTA